MGFIEFFFIAATLSLDTFAISLAGGLAGKEITGCKRVRIVLSFALVQPLFFLIAWYAASPFVHIIAALDHWIAFFILLLLGLKVIADSIRGRKGNSMDLSDNRQLLLLSAATSVDALAVGVSIAFIESDPLRIYTDGLILALVSAIAATAGVIGASKIGGRFPSKASFAGGVILVLLGIKILVEHIC